MKNKNQESNNPYTSGDIAQPMVQTERWISVLVLFIGALFTSAFLMFELQLMFGKVLLPLLGGSPSVWNTCMAFYQVMLFLGYYYAHYIGTHYLPRRQVLIHSALILISLISLPITNLAGSFPPVDESPVLWLFFTLLVSIGLPFFVVSATAPLLQKWFSTIGHQESHDPYFLYAASNAGSMIALLSYPFLIEPNVGLDQQRIIWSVGFLVLGGLILICGLILWRSHQSPQTNTQETSDQPSEIPSTLQKLHWVVLAFVPSSLLLGVTSYISTDVASVPLLWVIPLTLYLLSFVLVFSRQGLKLHPLMVAIQPVILLPFLVFSFINPAIIPYWVNLGLHLAAFFFAIMVCHGELARSRPHIDHLTSFYLIMAFGGMLGGMFNTFVAPIIFDSVIEYPIMIIVALLLRPALKEIEASKWRKFVVDLAFPAMVLISGVYTYHSMENFGEYIDLIGTVLILLVGISYALRFRPYTLSAMTAVLLFFALSLHSLVSNVIAQDRTFFGVLSIQERTFRLGAADKPNKSLKFRELWHGTTKHGAQHLNRSFEKEPLSYYSRQGPIGQFFSAYDKLNDHWRVGAIGLGTGAMACYAKNTQKWDFFEIDPTVVKIAQNPSYFTYLQRCSPKARMIVGDARVSLNQLPDKSYDVIVIDAFSSDAVPTHLLTEEAIAIYLSKLEDNGIIAFHITNRHLALKKVLSNLVRQMELSALIQEYKPTQKLPEISVADWVVVSKSSENLQLLQQSRLGNWVQLPLYFGMAVWTDDFTDIVSVWK